MRPIAWSEPIIFRAGAASDSPRPRGRPMSADGFMAALTCVADVDSAFWILKKHRERER